MPKISVVSFIHNEADTIRGFLENVTPHVDQVLLVDLESTDGTVDIAYEFTRDIYRKPHLICGDAYKEFLTFHAAGDWLLWAYPDERFNPKFLSEMHKLAESQNFDAYAVMRHEYRDGIKLVQYATNENPNYQNRLHRKCNNIFYTELVHAELHGSYRTCYLPADYWMEHWKKVSDQEFDNCRLYIEYKHLLWKYRDTKVEPYRTFIESYHRIVSESEDKNRMGERMRHPAEEMWWEWMKHKGDSRKTLDEWKSFLEANPIDRTVSVDGQFGEVKS